MTVGFREIIASNISNESDIAASIIAPPLIDEPISANFDVSIKPNIGEEDLLFSCFTVSTRSSIANPR